jgi:hypothetical protein
MEQSGGRHLRVDLRVPPVLDFEDLSPGEHALELGRGAGDLLGMELAGDLLGAVE